MQVHQHRFLLNENTCAIEQETRMYSLYIEFEGQLSQDNAVLVETVTVTCSG